METLTRLVSESLARHGFDRPLDYRRLQWSRWFRCESHHSLLSVPSKPGVFALAEEIVDFGTATAHVGTTALGCPAERSSAAVEERRFSAASEAKSDAALAAVSSEAEARRMLAVTQFFEDEDMAFVLDRMLSQQNPMRARLNSGRYFVRFVVIEDQAQRRNICVALNQWIVSSAEKVTGIGAHFATSLEFAENLGGTAALDTQPRAQSRGPAERSSAAPIVTSSTCATAPQLDSGAATNIHCPALFPSGF